MAVRRCTVHPRRLLLCAKPLCALLLAGGKVAPVPARGGLLLGVRPRRPVAFDLEFDTDDWSLLMYTDGLIEELPRSA